MGEDCQLTGDVGVIVQIALALLVGVVLITEYCVEYLGSLLRSGRTVRSFRTFWFDSYKICAGALVSHIFNIVVSVGIDKLSSNADQCAIYALAFFYEACGVPFVQLLQYGVIQYALRMSSLPSNDDNNSYHERTSINPRPPLLDETCRQRWTWISKPGIYDANRYPVNDCLHCRQCQEPRARCNYVKTALLLLVIVCVSLSVAVFGWKHYGYVWYVSVSLGFLVCVFLISSMIAPISSLWQTMQWVTVKIFEKAIWSLFAMAQASVFAKWSRAMSTGDPSLDAWLYIAIVPIIMNAFMFFMFSRISRLKLPCFAPKYSEKLEKGRERHEASLQQQHNNASDAILVTSPSSSLNLRFDKKEAFKVGIVFMLLINMTLLIIAASFLGYQGALESIWILFISMIVVPLICSVLAIYAFAYFVDRGIHVCQCCVNKSNARRMRNSNANGMHRYSQNNGVSNSASINKIP